MLEEGDVVEYETKPGRIRGFGRVLLHNGVPQVHDYDRRLPIAAWRVLLLRVTRGGEVVAEVQGLASRKSVSPKLRRLRAEFGIGGER